jgi:protein gp37
MSDNTGIEWATASWNPLAGCTRASSGCDFCYAAKMSLRLEAMALADIAAGKDPGGKRKYIGIATKNGKGVPAFNGTINLDWDELQRPYRWRKPRLVFVNSMSDLFHKDVPDYFILSAVNVMRDNPQHTFQVLTKRPDRAAEWVSRLGAGLPDNVWMGTSVENQETADLRIPELLKIPAAVRFLSCEPLLGKIYFKSNWLIPYRIEYDNKPTEYFKNVINLVIVGGESGSNARRTHLEWVYNTVQQCKSANVLVFVKQMGDNPYYAGKSLKGKFGNKGHDMSKWPDALQVREMPTPYRQTQPTKTLIDGRPEWTVKE